MKILLSNDDGYTAVGIAALANALAEFAVVQVVAPVQDRSGVSNALTLDRPLRLSKAANGYWTVDGTPADCVHLALTGAMDFVPDIVCSGINDGANLGDDTLYSGTVAAAMEGYQFGVPSFAFSMVQKRSANLEQGASIAAQLVKQLSAPLMLAAQQGKPALLNVNIPEQAQGMGNLEVTRLGKRARALPAVEILDPRGHQLFWLGPAGPAKDSASGTDFHAVAQGKVSITSLGHDLTASDGNEFLAAYL